MTTYVINPITDELESAQPKQTVGDKFKLQTFVRDRFVTGGSVETPKRGLVTEPGSYAGESFLFSDFAKQLNIKPQTLSSYISKNPEAIKKINKYFTTTIGTTSGNPITYTLKKNVNLANAIKDIKTEIGRTPVQGTDAQKLFVSQEVSKANAGDKFVTAKDILRKVQQKFKLKALPSIRSYPVLSNLNTRAQKADQVLKNMLMEKTPLNGFWHEVAAKRMGMNKIAFRRMLEDVRTEGVTKFRGAVPTYEAIKNQGADFISGAGGKGIPKAGGAYDFIKNLSFTDQLSKALEIQEGMPVLKGITTRSSTPKNKTIQFAFRNWALNQGKGDIKLFDKKGKLIPYEYGKVFDGQDISFKYKGEMFSLRDRPYKVNNISDPTVLKKYFPEVEKITNEMNNFSQKKIDNPFKPGSKIKIKDLATKIQVDGYKYKPALGSFAILHGPEGVKNKPFTGLSYNTSDINLIESSLSNKAKAGMISNKDFRKAIKTLRSQFPEQNFQKSIEDRILDQAKTIKKFKGTGKPLSVSDQVKKLINLRNTAQNVFNKLPFKGLRIVPGAAAAAIDYGMFAGLLGVPVDEAMIGASGWLTKKPELGKALGTIATQYSEGKINLSEFGKQSLPILKEIAKEQAPKIPPVVDEINEKMGEGMIKTADDIQEPESAKRRKMFEEANERLGNIDEMEISDIDNPFMAAMGGRVGFQEGSPPEIPGDDPDYSELQVMLDNPDKYNTFPKGTFAEEMDKAVYGTNEERNLLQKFNSMFLDPRVYPYYAQKLTSGAANIPELAFRFPAALAYLYGQANLALATGDLDRIKGKTLVEALEILDPKYTREIKNTKFGDVVGISDKSMNEQDKTEGQKFVGGTFELGAEAIGPATPLFLFKMFPKLSKQIKDLVGTVSAAEKVNKEIEKNMTVDQTRRDLILTIGAGGAAAALKFLGLDKLIKAPKATKAVTSAVKSGGTPQYFFDFVDLIKRKGKDVSDRQAVVERQKVIEYKDYTLTDTDGYITIRKTDEEMGIDQMMEYKPAEGVVDEVKGTAKEIPPQYDEVSSKPDPNDPGNFDSESGFESIDDVLEELSKDGKKYSKEELEEMGIILGGAIKTEMAEGGIIAGVKSGPAPKSGPTPHGLPYVAKNVRPIKERK